MTGPTEGEIVGVFQQESGRADRAHTAGRAGQGRTRPDRTDHEPVVMIGRFLVGRPWKISPCRNLDGAVAYLLVLVGVVGRQLVQSTMSMEISGLQETILRRGQHTPALENPGCFRRSLQAVCGEAEGTRQRNQPNRSRFYRTKNCGIFCSEQKGTTCTDPMAAATDVREPVSLLKRVLTVSRRTID